MTLSIMTLSIMTLSITTLSITEHCNAEMLIVIYDECYLQALQAECRYADCCYAECCSATFAVLTLN
jgi:hypothetical protein